MKLTQFKSEFEKMINRNYFSDKVHPLRQDAFSKFLEIGLPTKKWEDWRFTNLSSISKGNFRISEIQDAPKGDLVISPYKLKDIDTDFVHVLIDGQIVKSGGKELALELEEKGYSWLES